MEKVERIVNDLKCKYKSQTIKINVPERLRCQLCQFILNRPYQTSCGCIFCEKCIKAWLINNENCPGSEDDCKHQSLNLKKGIKEDKARSREVSKFKVKCIFVGCDSEIELAKMSDHVETCVFRVIECDLCKEDVLGKNVSLHKEMECREGQEICVYCQSPIKRRILREEHNNKKHKNICVKYRGECPYNCGIGGSVLLVLHREVCVNRPLRCPFGACGCQVEDLCEEQLNGHLRDCILIHSELLNKLAREKDEQISALRALVTKLDTQIRELKYEINSVNQTFDLSQDGVPNTVGYEDDVEFRDGVFLWRIEHFTSLRLDAVSGRNLSLSSQPFYTSDFGYKMCLKIYPNGDGLGRDTHLSFFFVIMKGDYDDILQWPFNPTVKLSAMSGSSPTMEHSELFKANEKSQCYDKPKTSMNVGSGSPKFLTQDHLVKSYLINDSLYLKAEVLNETR